MRTEAAMSRLLRLLDNPWTTLALVVVYFTGMTALALVVDLRFFFNDAVSGAVWLAIGLSALGGALAAGSGEDRASIQRRAGAAR
jgi:NO-binding membrane sensor protein with MHYT domain